MLTISRTVTVQRRHSRRKSAKPHHVMGHENGRDCVSGLRKLCHGTPQHTHTCIENSAPIGAGLSLGGGFGARELILPSPQNAEAAPRQLAMSGMITSPTTSSCPHIPICPSGAPPRDLSARRHPRQSFTRHTTCWRRGSRDAQQPAGHLRPERPSEGDDPDSGPDPAISAGGALNHWKQPRS